MVWEIEEERNIIKIGTTEVNVLGEITTEEIKRVAKESGLRTFVVVREGGENLEMDDFPTTGTVCINSYNAPKTE